jgi:hypothetical protein
MKVRSYTYEPGGFLGVADRVGYLFATPNRRNFGERRNAIDSGRPWRTNRAQQLSVIRLSKFIQNTQYIKKFSNKWDKFNHVTSIM